MTRVSAAGSFRWRSVVLVAVLPALLFATGQGAVIPPLPAPSTSRWFFAGGWIMNHFGRLWTVVPPAVGLGIGHVVLAFTHDLPNAIGWFIAVALFLSLANGLGAGMLMTLGSDIADRRHPAPFLGAWRFTIDVGAASAPLSGAAVTAVASLSLAVGALGVLGLGSAVVMRIFTPRKLGIRT